VNLLHKETFGKIFYSRCIFCSCSDFLVVSRGRLHWKRTGTCNRKSEATKFNVNRFINFETCSLAIAPLFWF
jgi:hypothetical protein